MSKSISNSETPHTILEFHTKVLARKWSTGEENRCHNPSDFENNFFYIKNSLGAVLNSQAILVFNHYNSSAK